MGSRISRPDEAALPLSMLEAEEAMIERRRQVAGEQSTSAGRPAVGLAISGGGIRSATFALGVLQALTAMNLLRKFDYLSTVSGGGYIGSFLGTLFIDRRVEGVKEPPPPARPGWEKASAALADPHGPELRWLRENGRYMSPNGAGDSWLAAAVVLRNWVAVQLVLCLFFLCFFLAADFLRALLATWLPTRAPQLLSSGLVWQGIWWSPFLIAPALTLLFWMIPAGWAYWLVPADRDRLPGTSLPTVLAISLWLALVWLGAHRFVEGTRRVGPPSPAEVAAVCAGIVMISLSLLFRASRGRASTLVRAEQARHSLSVFLKVGLIGTLALLAFALIDSLAQTLYLHILKGRPAAWQGGVLPAIATVAAFGQKLAAFLHKRRGSTFKLPVTLLALLAALLLATALLTGLSAASHALAWGTQGPPPAGAFHRGPLAIALLAALLLSIVIGHTFTFLNQSSQASLYAARLTRAYLGASNPARQSGEGQSVTEVIAGDDVPLAAYQPHENGGPLHLINTTLNETVDGRSQIEQQDRKGMNLAIGPAGLSVGVHHHAMWSEAGGRLLSGDFGSGLIPVAPAVGFRVFQPKAGEDKIVPESLALGRWIAISGAAFSTGLGWRTSLGLSLLCGLFNLRLGHWWWSGTEPERRAGQAGANAALRTLGRLFSRAFPVQMHLVDELLARFPGTARRNWYLTDGGHFENTAAYELVRRRVPLIVVLDDGEDASYQFGDVGQLVRKARLDFDAEVRFLDAAELEHLSLQDRFGTIDQIRSNGPRAAGAFHRGCAALATITYGSDEQPASLLLVLKPALLGDEPQDVREYAGANPSFPQQSTTDQYFDEAQWESYRRLGEHLACKVFGGSTDGEGWRPDSLDPTPLFI